MDPIEENRIILRKFLTFSYPLEGFLWSHREWEFLRDHWISISKQSTKGEKTILKVVETTVCKLLVPVLISSFQLNGFNNSQRINSKTEPLENFDLVFNVQIESRVSWLFTEKLVSLVFWNSNIFLSFVFTLFDIEKTTDLSWRSLIFFFTATVFSSWFWKDQTMRKIVVFNQLFCKTQLEVDIGQSRKSTFTITSFCFECHFLHGKRKEREKKMENRLIFRKVDTF